MSKKRANTPEAIEKAEPTSALLPSGYSEFLVDLKNRVRSAQLKAAVTVNSEMIQLYWDIGRAIVERQEAAKWGGKIIVQIGEDLQKEFPGIAGFSRQNIYRMRAFFLAYSDGNPIVSQAVRQLAHRPAFLPSLVIVSQPVRQLGRSILPQLVGEFRWEPTPRKTPASA